MTSDIGTADGAPEPAGTDAAAPETDDVEQPRLTRASLGSAGRILLPYWFAASGIALGIGGVIQDKPIAGACGAVAGVTAGLLYQGRARHFQRQAEALRDRLRHQRGESETVQAELRESVRTLRTEVWELRLAQQVAEMTSRLKLANAEPSKEIRAIAEALPTQPLDLRDLPFASRELRDHPEDGEPEVVESRALLPAPKPEPQVDVEQSEPTESEPQAKTESVVDVTASDEADADEADEADEDEVDEIDEVLADETEAAAADDDSDHDSNDDQDDDQDADGTDAQVIDLHGPAGDGDKRVAAKKAPAIKPTASSASTSENRTAAAG